MSPQFCKIGKSNLISSDIIRLKKQYNLLIEKAYNISMTDSSLSDILYFKAKKIKKVLFNLNVRGVAF